VLLALNLLVVLADKAKGEKEAGSKHKDKKKVEEDDD